MKLSGARLPGAVGLCLGAGLAVVLTPFEAIAQVTAYAFVPNSGSANVHVIETVSGTVLGAPVAVGSSPQAVVVTPDGRRAYIGHIGSATPYVTPIDLATRTALPNIAVASTALGMSVHPNGSKVYVAGFGTNKVHVIDTATNTITNSITVGNNPGTVAVSPDGLRAYVTNTASSSFHVLDLTTETVIGSPVPVGVSPGGAVVTLDNKRVYIANFGSNTVSVYNVDTGTVTATIPVSANPAAVALSPGGSEVAVGNYVGDTISLISTLTNAVTPVVGVNGPFGVGYTPDGTQLYILRYDNNDVVRMNTATHALSAPIAVGTFPYALTTMLSPPVITQTCGGCGALSIANDAALTAIGVRSFVVFHNGTLRLTGNWTTSRHISLLSTNGTINTQAFDATVNGNVINAGALTKTGFGTLTLNGANTHAGGTTVSQGAVIVNGTHAAPITVQNGALGGNGTVGVVNVLNNSAVLPGVGGPGILHATSVSFASTALFTAQINGPTAGTEYDRLDATTGVTLNNAALNVQLGYTPAPGTVFTIVTRAIGQFGGQPEGAIIDAGPGRKLRLSYHGGSGNDVTLTLDGPPTISGLTNESIFLGSAMSAKPFTVGDDLTPAASLVVSAVSSNHALLPDGNITFGGSGTARTISATTLPGVSGVTTITVTAADSLGQTASQAFTLTVEPRVYQLAEGATGSFFSTDILLANPNGAAAPVVVTFFKEDGTTVVQDLTLAATSRTTIRANDVAGMEATAFSTTVTSTSGAPLIVERTMWWDASGYGAHSEKASPSAMPSWYFAEGSQGYFHTYFLLLNPNAAATTAHVTYLLEGEPAVQRDYVVEARSRRTIDAAGEPALIDRSFGALITFDLPGMAERAMYFGATPQFTGGHASSGVTAPSATWFLAEGATGSFFETFVLMANPNDAAANVNVTYLPANGIPVDRTHVIPGHQRLTINIATEDPSLASAAVSTRLSADQPIIAERSQYWPAGAWHEAHNSAGETATAPKWGLAEGRVGGSNHAQTYILIANPGTSAADITATFLRADGTTIVKTFNVGPTSRFNIAVTGPGSNVPELTDESFGTVIESTQPVIVERSLYADSGGVTWAAGTVATATRLP